MSSSVIDRNAVVTSIDQLLQKHVNEQQTHTTFTKVKKLKETEAKAAAQAAKTFLQRFFSMGDHRPVVMETEKRERANSHPPSHLTSPAVANDLVQPFAVPDDNDLYGDIDCANAKRNDGVDVDETDNPDEVRLSSLQSFRSKIVFLIHHRVVQLILMSLLVLDVFVVIVELIIESHQECDMNIEPELCIGYSDDHYPHSKHDFVQNSSGLFAPTGCGVFGKSVLQHNLHDVEVALSWISRIVLMVFAAEITTLMCCLGRDFFTILYTLDAIVVFLSLIFSFVFNAREGADTGLLVFLRVWRFARVLHGFGVTVHNKEHNDAHELEGEEDHDVTTIKAISLTENTYKSKPQMERAQRNELIAYCRLVEGERNDLRSSTTEQ